MWDLFIGAAYQAHGYCLLWTPWLVAFHAVPDFLIFVAYTSIPLAIIQVLRKRPELQAYSGLTWLFAAFILLCGLTHLAGLITLWVPIYAFQAILKSATAIVSLVTAFILFRMVPDLVKIPTPSQHEAVNEMLSREIENHVETLDALVRARDDLEQTVKERTTELKTSNEQLKTLARETVHRSKNLLTVIQSLARQTARGADSVETFLETLMGRIEAMARATNVMVETGEPDVRAVIEHQLDHYLETFPDQIRINGDHWPIRTEAAQQIGLLVHELATNSVKYGGLSVPEGRVRLDWEADQGTGEFRLSWSEWGAPPRPEPISNGFGTRLTTLAVPSQLGGEATRELTDKGLAYTLTVPLDEIEPRTRAYDPIQTQANFPYRDAQAS